jgi:hypothetical protein
MCVSVTSEYFGAFCTPIPIFSQKYVSKLNFLGLSVRRSVECQLLQGIQLNCYFCLQLVVPLNNW